MPQDRCKSFCTELIFLRLIGINEYLTTPVVSLSPRREFATTALPHTGTGMPAHYALFIAVGTAY